MTLRNDMQMIALPNSEYKTMLHHLSDQLAEKMQRVSLHNFNIEFCMQSARDALVNEFVDTKTPREWLADAGKRVGVDTADCVGV